MQVLKCPLINALLNSAGFLTPCPHRWVRCESERPVGGDVQREDCTPWVASAGVLHQALPLVDKTEDKGAPWSRDTPGPGGDCLGGGYLSFDSACGLNKLGCVMPFQKSDTGIPFSPFFKKDAN